MSENRASTHENDGNTGATASAMVATSDTVEGKYGVVVYVYDLSHGMASTYAPMFLGIDLDAIYHTSVVVYGKEYYIDQGIQTCAYPGNTKYGMPIDVIDMGDSFIDEEVFIDFISDLKNHDKQKYHAENYDLWNNNCNHFTDVCVEFLTGNNLDDSILRLPETVLNTPNGQLLKSMIGSRMGG
jgi:hypothetical protein